MPKMMPLAGLVLAVSLMTTAGCVGQEACSVSGGGLHCGAQVAHKSGTETYTFNNPSTQAMVNWGSQASSGTLTLHILDAGGRQVYQSSISGASQQGANGQTASGTPGDWTVKLEYSSFTGQVGLNVMGGSSGGGNYCPPNVPYCS